MAAITWDIAKSHAGQIDLTNGDLTATINVAPWRSIGATQSWATGKWYWEVTATNCQTYPANYSLAIGVGTSAVSVDSYVGIGANGWGMLDKDSAMADEGAPPANSPLSAPYWLEGTVCGVALNMDDGEIFFHIDGVYPDSANPVTRANPHMAGIAGTIFPWCSMMTATSAVTANFGAAGPDYTIPSGYTMPDYVPASGMPSGRRGFTSRSGVMRYRR